MPGIRDLLRNAVLRGPLLSEDFSPDTVRVAQFERAVLAQRYARLLHTVAAGQDQSVLQPASVGS